MNLLSMSVRDAAKLAVTRFVPSAVVGGIVYVALFATGADPRGIGVGGVAAVLTLGLLCGAVSERLFGSR